MNENDLQKRKPFLEKAELFLNKCSSFVVLSLKDKAPFIIIIGVAALLIWQGWNHYRQAVNGSIEISMKTGTADTAQLFYDIGKGFSETDSSRVNIATTSTFHDYRFPIPNKPIRKMRFDPLSSAGTVTIRHMISKNGFGQTVRTIDLRSLQPLHEIRSLTDHDGKRTITTVPGAQDPQLEITLEQPLTIPFPTLRFFRLILIDLILASLMGFFLILCWNHLPWNLLKSHGQLTVLVLIAGLFRLTVVLTADLPAGDEINTYIHNAQQFAWHGKIPSLSEHPGVSIIYGLLIIVVEAVHSTLPGIVAANIVTVASGMLAALFVYLAIERFSDRRTAFLASLLLCVFPGCYFTIRGDLSLYFLFLSVFLFSLARLTAKPSWKTALISGMFGACLYLSRSDGVYVVVLTLIFAFFVLKNIRRFIPLTVAAFCLSLALFMIARHGVMGDWGAGTGQRAFDAFYQAEGLLDRQGGSWQDYTERGLKRFGPPEKYGNSMIMLAMTNSSAVGERIAENLAIVKKYISDSSGIHFYWIPVILACCLLNKRILQMAIVAILPCILTSCIYLAFYFQRSYFVMLSFGLVIGCAAGLSALVTYVTSKMKLQKYAFGCIFLLGVVLASSLGYRTYHSFPGSGRSTAAGRYWDSLVFLRQQCVNKGGKFFAYDHAGSRSMYIYAGGGEPSVSQGDVEGTSADNTLGLLKSNGVRFVLAGKEHQKLWGLSDQVKVVFSNTQDDVRVLDLNM